MTRSLSGVSKLLIFVFLLGQGFFSNALDLKNAVVVTPADLSGPEKKALTMLVDEVEKRTHVRWVIQAEIPSTNALAIVVGSATKLKDLARAYAADLREPGDVKAAEGYRICLKQAHDKPAIFIIGNDSRGVLFGVGRLLRELHMERGSVTIDEHLDITSSPKYPLRGHQLGYRPKCNSYDAWDLPVWEQYFRDLAVFGCNAVELIPPRSDDDADSPHFPRPPMEMMVGMSRLADAYGLAVWIWFPAMDKNYSDPKTVEFALKEWADVFQKLPRLDAVFVPGGDPGHTQPRFLMSLLAQQTKSLHRYHPKAQMWVSPQGFNQVWLDEFLEILNRERPDWLNGVVYGPQVRVGVAKLRSAVPQQYPIRHYPDITHSRQCQFPVPDWDRAYAVTEARECINPRPEDEATIFRVTQPHTIGFLTYSEGCNDDVNKIVWSALGWDPNANVTNILREYSRYFIGERYTDKFAQGLLALEQNWRGALRTNQSVEATLGQFQAMENAALPADLKNWRFQQGLFRAYYDAYVRHRLIHETDLEERAMEHLRMAYASGALAAMSEAAKILAQPPDDPTMNTLRGRIHELGEALFQSIAMQLSVEKYKAIAVDRGASLDTLDFPLNNRPWLDHQFQKVRDLASESVRLEAIQKLVEWTDPGAGGFYDDLGNSAQQPHLVRGPGFDEDPERMQSVRVDFEEDLVVDEPEEKPDAPRRSSWIDHAETLYDTPLQMRYTSLDPKARYKLRVVYGGDNFKRKMRLVANNGLEVHPFISKSVAIKPLEFVLPAAATQSGELTLSWFGEPGLGGNGRNCQVSEVWLLKESSSPNR